MADERDTDRMAGELLNLLKGSLTKPASGTAAIRPQVDDNSVLNMIKDILKQNLPSGPKPREQASAPTTQQAYTVPSQYSAAGGEVQVGGWEGLFRRQGSERQIMHERHERERAEMHQRHIQEMEAATGGQGGSSGVTVAQTMRRDARTMGTTRVSPRRTSPRRTGLV